MYYGSITNANGLTEASICISGSSSRMSIKQDQVIELLLEYASLVSKKLAKKFRVNN
ncbi:hypothetical protein V7112_22180 [Bacillus sp. JJ1566]|uniref:hypothetical protein n=1 Tax=Bacillus sp. JJ1566 TaxID=3122961 RepID=UPI0030006737